MREGDIEAIRNKRKDEGRPLKSKIIIEGERQYFYEVNKRGNVKINEEVKTSGA